MNSIVVQFLHNLNSALYYSCYALKHNQRMYRPSIIYIMTFSKSKGIVIIIMFIWIAERDFKSRMDID